MQVRGSMGPCKGRSRRALHGAGSEIVLRAHRKLRPGSTELSPTRTVTTLPSATVQTDRVFAVKVAASHEVVLAFGSAGAEAMRREPGEAKSIDWAVRRTNRVRRAPSGARCKATSAETRVFMVACLISLFLLWCVCSGPDIGIDLKACRADRVHRSIRPDLTRQQHLPA